MRGEIVLMVIGCHYYGLVYVAGCTNKAAPEFAYKGVVVSASVLSGPDEDIHILSSLAPDLFSSLNVPGKAGIPFVR